MEAGGVIESTTSPVEGFGDLAITEPTEPEARFPAAVLVQQGSAILRAWGWRDADASTIAEALVETDRRGTRSHGLGLLLYYRFFLDQGLVNPLGEVKTVMDEGAVALLDGGDNLGYLSAFAAADLAIHKARLAGVGAVAVRGSQHFGAAGLYARRIADSECVGIAMTNVPSPSVRPSGAVQSLVGTNPIAISAPGGGETQFNLDMATSVVAASRIALHARLGQEIPSGWVYDSNGNPVTDPVAAFPLLAVSPLGSTLEQSSYKGLGLALAVDILCGVLTGANYTTRLLEKGSPINTGHLVIALNVESFRDSGSFLESMDALVRSVHATPALPGLPSVMIPGDRQQLAMDESDKNGIPVDGTVRAAVRKWSADYGFSFLLS